MYPAFVWWQGVIENRLDPDKLGRYKVRIFGYHTRDKVILPVSDLPWAIPMQPVTSAAISGVGTSPNGLVEGSTVIGFFADGNDAQIPIIMGSWGCMSILPEDEGGNVVNIDKTLTGFYDPRTVEEAPHGLYPRQDLDKSGTNGLKEPDSSRLARGGAAVQTHYTYMGKEEVRIKTVEAADAVDAVEAVPAVEADPDNGIEASPAVAASPAVEATDGYAGIPKATAPLMTMYDLKETSLTHPKTKADLLVEEASAILAMKEYVPTPVPKYEEEYWEEPVPGGANSKYPYNHVTESESGHVREVDDTPGHERIHNYHRSGTYDEINATGTKTVKIVGDNYEIIVKDKNLLVKGDFNVTVDGDYNLNVLGNKYEDILGHSFTSVRGNKVTKVQGNSVTEIMSTEARMTAGDKFITAQRSLVNRIGVDYQKHIGGKYKTIANIGITTTCLGDYDISVTPTVAMRIVAGVPIPEVSTGSFTLRTMGDISIATSILPASGELTMPRMSLQSSYINTWATMGHIENIGLAPILKIDLSYEPGEPVGKYTQINIADAEGVASQENILIGDAKRTILVGNDISEITAGNIEQSVLLGTITQTATAGIITLKAPVINLNSV